MRRLALATALVSLVPTLALAQSINVNAPPSYGEELLNAGFEPDPLVVEVLAGGTISAATADPACVGSIAPSPDFRLHYVPGDYPLVFSVVSDADTTLVINGPDGQWQCNDDVGGWQNPSVFFATPLEGAYDVWVGTYETGAADALLLVTERAAPPDLGFTAFGTQPDVNLPPEFGSATLSSNFDPDPLIVPITVTAPNVDTGALPGECFVGAITIAPTFELTYTAGAFPLIISVDSESDPTLVVNTPSGDYVCDDDGGDLNLNPALRFETPESGVYDIWVGTWDPTAPLTGSIYISEVTSR